MPFYQKKKQIKDKNGNVIKEIIDYTKDGRSWCFRVWYTTIYGERKQKNSERYFTKDEAKQAEREFLNKIETKINHNGKITFKDIHKLHYEFKKNCGMKTATLNSYDDKFNHLKMLENLKLIDYNILHFNNWKDYMCKNKNLEISTKNDVYKYLKTLLNFAHDYYGYNFAHVYNKMTKFHDPALIKKEMKIYNYNQFRKFISYEEDIRWKCVFKTLYFCGLRRGEMMALQWKDIDFEKKVMHIYKEIPPNCNNKNWHFEDPKTANGKRLLPICNELLNDLKELYNECKKYINFDGDWFVLGDINPITRSSIYTERDRLTALSGLETIRPHDFRHSCASLLINNGAPVTLVSKFLGHYSVKETLDTYAHLFGDQLDSVINVINDLPNNVNTNEEGPLVTKVDKEDNKLKEKIDELEKSNQEMKEMLQEIAKNIKK